MPIWLMKVGNFFKLLWLWLKNNWIVVPFAAVAVYTFFLAKNKSAIIDQLTKEFQAQQTQNREQLNELRRIQQEQIVKQQEINKKYNEVLDRIQVNYQEQLKTLDAEKERDLRRIIATNKDNPEAMAKDINILFGIPIFPNS
jgi:phosphoglycolate phosphatase-like HAD superfamily hydrolase